MMEGFERKDLSGAKMLRSAKLAGEMDGLLKDLMEGKDVGWDRMRQGLRWLQDSDKKRNWMRIFLECNLNPYITKASEDGEKKTICMLPWKNRRIWGPFMQDIYEDMASKFLEQGDMLSIVSMDLGPTSMDFERPVSGIRLAFPVKVKK